jgi:hypothetical protein
MKTQRFILWCLKNGINPFPRIQMIGRPIEDDEIIFGEKPDQVKLWLVSTNLYKGDK